MKTNENIKYLKKVNKEKGITLIALVITIMVIIILSTISIKTIMGDDGILSQTKEVKKIQSNREVHEDEELNSLMKEYEEAHELD